MNEFKEYAEVELEIITPCFNEEENVPNFVNNFENLLFKKNISNYLITIVDDGSCLSTKRYFEKYVNNEKVRIIQLSRNYGHQTAIYAGLENSLGKYLIVLDIDLQDPPEVAFDLYEKCRTESNDFVRGVRNKREGEKFFKILTANIFYKLLSLLSNDKGISSESSGDFYCMNKKFKEALLINLPSRLYLRGQISKIGFNQSEIKYDRKSRKYGQTKYSLSKMFSLAYSGLLASSTKPLRISGLLGLIGLASSLLITVVLIFLRFYYGTSTPGWTFIVSSIYLCTSMILISLSILSEYLSVLINSTIDKKRYFIRRIL